MSPPSAATVKKLISLTRRAIVRLDALEARLVAVEKRLHWLDDLPETVEGLTSLASRVAIDDDDIRRILREGLKPEIDPEDLDRAVREHLPKIAKEAVLSYSNQLLQARINAQVDKQLRKRGL